MGRCELLSIFFWPSEARENDGGELIFVFSNLYTLGASKTCHSTKTIPFQSLQTCWGWTSASPQHLNWTAVFVPWCPNDSKSLEGFAELSGCSQLCIFAIMLSLSVNLMGWAPQEIKWTRKIKYWGLTPFSFQICLFVFVFLGALAPSFRWGTQ